MSKKMNLIMENWRKFVNEDVDPKSIDPNLYPTKLSQAQSKPELAKVLATTGTKDPELEDDKAVAQLNASFPANTLLAGQTTMDLDKFVGMAIQMFLKIGGFTNGPGGDLGAIISSDNHIMDGHHRWAGTLLVNPQTSVSGLQVKVPGEKLVGILNVWTVAHGGKGKKSTHNLADLNGDVVSKRLLELCKGGLSGGKKPISSQELSAAAQKNNITFEQMATTAKTNWDKVNPSAKIKSWMPTKLDMPAIEPEQLQAVASDIQSGKMDIVPPYSKQTNYNIARGGAVGGAGGSGQTPAQIKASGTLQKESLKKIVRQVIRENLKKK